jgi:predicted XRE-type DNA-binding protein
VSRNNRKEKKKILNMLDQLDKKTEDTPLNADELDLKNCLKNRLSHMIREEEIKW